MNKWKSMTVLGILLAIVGVLALVYQGFSYTRQEKVFDVGPIHAAAPGGDDACTSRSRQSLAGIGFVKQGRRCSSWRRETKA